MTAARERPDDDQVSALAYVGQRVRRHVHWARTQGVGRLIEEDRLDPAERVTTAARKWSWRRRYGVRPGTAVPVYVVGVQRSGTNMLVRGLEAAPEVEVHNENDRRVFSRYQLRSDAIVAETIGRSRHAYVLFKPLCDSHRLDELLALPEVQPGLAVWAYRGVDDRARSAVAKFGDANLRALRGIASGAGQGLWQAQRLSPETIELLSTFDYETMTPDTAACLFWHVRNSLFFELGYDHRNDVLLLSYDALVREPEGGLRELCAFLGFPWRPELAAHIEQRSSRRRPLDIDPRVRELCDGLGERLQVSAGTAASRPVR